jgi:hypothetical protein
MNRIVDILMADDIIQTGGAHEVKDVSSDPSQA